MILKEIAETSAYLVAAIGSPIAAGWALLQWRDGQRQRIREYRWRQADLGRQLIDNLFVNDRDADVALQFLDAELDSVVVDGLTFQITGDHVREALTFDRGLTPVGRQIRKHFDALFYHLERFANLIEVGLITLDDVRHPTAYYCKLLLPYNDVIEQYLLPVGYGEAWALIRTLQSQETE